MATGKKILSPYTLLNAQDMSASFTSASTNTFYLDRIAIQITSTGAPVGTFTIQTSLDQVDWLDISFGTAITPFTGTTNRYFFDIAVTSIPYIRINFVAGVGSVGTMTAKIFSRES